MFEFLLCSITIVEARYWPSLDRFIRFQSLQQTARPTISTTGVVNVEEDP